MAAITMESMSLVAKLRRDFPQFRFQNASVSRWSSQEKTIYYVKTASPRNQAILLHELGHALCNHTGYEQDIELLTLEREAWQTARSLAATYGVPVDDDVIENHLDTYREWLHARSRCPHCHSAGVQRTSLEYYCVLCEKAWTANDARQCSLRRYTKTPL